jgi:hypothetical protein
MHLRDSRMAIEVTTVFSTAVYKAFHQLHSSDLPIGHLMTTFPQLVWWQPP